MDKLKKFFNIWGGTISVVIVFILLLFALGCDIYTLVVNPLFGWFGLSGTICALIGDGIIGYYEVKEAIAKRNALKKHTK